MEKISGNNLARAFAISLVVANHSIYLPLGGGLNFLLLMAGFNLAAFSFSKSTHYIIVDFVQMIKKILLPAFIIILFYGIFFNNIVWQELLFVSYLLKVEKVALIPVWYCQVLLQMSLLLIIIFKLTNFSVLVNKNPIVVTLITLSVTIGINLLFWQSYPWNRWPHMYLWNFCLGWAVWAILKTPNLKNKISATVLTATTALIIFYPSMLEHKETIFRVVIFLILTNIFIWCGNLTLPKLFTVTINIVAKSTLYIFLFHWSFIKLYQASYSIDQLGKWDGLISIFLGIVGSCIIWLIITSIINTKNRFNAIYNKT